MLRDIVLTFVMIVCACPIEAQNAGQQQDTQRSNPNPFDLSAARELVGNHVPTASSVALLQQQAQTAFAGGDCKAGAIDALDKFAREANVLSNLITRGVQPYYGASYDQKKDFPVARLNQLVPIEKLANDYRTLRDRAMIMQAECLTKAGDTSKAVAVYYQALNLLSVNDTEWWDRTVRDLFSILQITK